MIRIGVVGVGEFGTGLARDVVSTAGTELAALADVNEERLQTAGERFDLPAEALFADETEMYAGTSLDAVVIATPPGFHRRQIFEALDRGLHVLCEKPLVTTLADARAVADRTASGSEVLMAGYQRHLNPGFVAARDRWRDGDREPRFVTGELTQDWTHHFGSGTNWRTDPELGGGGHLFSVGTHVVESILWMTGLTPRTVTAQMEFYDDAERIDTQSSLTVRFENGATASIGDSAIAPATREHVHVWDDEGAAYLTGEGWGRRELTTIDADGNETKPDLAYDEAPSKVEAFAEAITTGSPPPATAEDALRVTALLEAAYEAARAGESVAVDID